MKEFLNIHPEVKEALVAGKPVGMGDHATLTGLTPHSGTR